jgi:hypothetical protein
VLSWGGRDGAPPPRRTGLNGAPPTDFINLHARAIDAREEIE